MLVQQYWVRRFPLTGEEEEITFSFFVWSNVSLGTTREQVQDVDFGMLLLMFAGIFSTLKKPHHLAFIRMSCDLADFLFMREQARANRKALAKDRTLHMERREQRREVNRNRTSASRRGRRPATRRGSGGAAPLIPHSILYHSRRICPQGLCAP